MKWATSKYGYILSCVSSLARSKNIIGSIVFFCYDYVCFDPMIKSDGRKLSMFELLNEKQKKNTINETKKTTTAVYKVDGE